MAVQLVHVFVPQVQLVQLLYLRLAEVHSARKLGAAVLASNHEIDSLNILLRVLVYLDQAVIGTHIAIYCSTVSSRQEGGDDLLSQGELVADMESQPTRGQFAHALPPPDFSEVNVPAQEDSVYTVSVEELEEAQPAG